MEASVALDAAGDGVVAVVALPPGAISSASDVDVEVLGDDTLLVRVPGCCDQPLRLALPLPINPDTGRVRFKRTTGKLTFTASAAVAATAARSGADAAAPAPPPGSTTATVTAAADSLTALILESSAEASPQPHVAAEKPAAASNPVGPEQPEPLVAVAAAPSPQARGTDLGESNSNPPCPGASDDAADTDTDDAALYRDFYCDSPHAAAAAAAAAAVAAAAAAAPSPPPPPPQAAVAAAANGMGTAAASSVSQEPDGAASVKAARVAAAFEPTGGTSSRDAGFSFTAPDLPPPPPLPPGLPPVAAPIDCRYLAVANGLRVSAHSGTAALAEAMGLRRRPSAAAAARQAERVGEILRRVADTLDAYGYAVLDNYISEAAIRAARGELRVMEPHYSPGMIWVGKEAETGAQISVSSVRGDVVLWLDDQALNATAFVKDGVRRACSFMQLQQLLADVDELVFEGLRPRLPYLAGLHRRSDAMTAVYPGKGSRFARHVDNTTGDGRRLTVLTYLNPDWREQQGGALRLFPVRQGSAGVVDVLPLAGRVALFLSAEVAHEVMPAFAPRHAVTLWYFDAGEHAAALTAAKVLPGASSLPTAQAAATALLRDLLADEAAAGIQATPEGCAELGTRVASLEPGAQQLLAAVLGLPNTTALVESMRGLTPDSLRRRREELRNMGLGSQHHAPDTSAHV
ncbi:hypothetical protein PLESTB_000195700 [Pleodorina starrii]|uniref:Fe2OG dioxygenase domain-containing protein n=1 Tax=Pleodorina starrii TaxID=330485 RepID=A0A9W6BBX3_9CHLO|nr:hypothetical protein PLESTM_000335600 [Pleodorina starrii]GLC49219.1 hypothetical protein PLESTB_000195700 [Pleodorina starrii]GLC73524.1 hypothetical protein PLESTF_001386900 [Pleodorina starrii]